MEVDKTLKFPLHFLFSTDCLCLFLSIMTSFPNINKASMQHYLQYRSYFPHQGTFALEAHQTFNYSISDQMN